MFSKLMPILALLLIFSCSSKPQKTVGGGIKPSVPESQIPYRTLGVTVHLTKLEAVPFEKSFLKKLKLAEGWVVNVFAQDLGDPRMMAVDPKSKKVFVSAPKRGQIIVMSDSDNDGVADTKSNFLKGYEGVHGLSIHNNKLFFIAMKTVYSVELGDSSKVRTLIKNLPDTGQHVNRSMSIGPDGKIYISIASNCNSCVDPNEMYATMQVADIDGSNLKTFASGLRDTIGFDWHPESKELFGMDHGTDWKGEEIPEEELNLITKGKHYGWPFCWNNKHVDENFIDEPKGKLKKDFCPTTESPLLTHTAHSAPIALKFYDKHTAFAALRGSWNRKVPKGYGVIRILFKDGKPQKIEDFMSGFVLENGKSQFGRPTGLAFLEDGSLLVSEDSSGVIYRVQKVK